MGYDEGREYESSEGMEYSEGYDAGYAAAERHQQLVEEVEEILHERHHEHRPEYEGEERPHHQPEYAEWDGDGGRGRRDESDEYDGEEEGRRPRIHLDRDIFGDVARQGESAQDGDDKPLIMIGDDLRVVQLSPREIEVYFTLRNDGGDLKAHTARTYLQVVGPDGDTIIDRTVGMGKELRSGESHFGGDKLEVDAQRCTVFVYSNYKDDGSYDDLKRAELNPGHRQYG